jgi:hypothetical protein
MRLLKSWAFFIHGAVSLRMPRLRLSIDDSHVIRPGCSAQCPQEPPTFTADGLSKRTTLKAWMRTIC